MIAIAAGSRLVNQFGDPLIGARSTPDLAKITPRKPDIEARFDAATNSDEFVNYWAAADSLDADASHSKAVRAKLVARSRYEVGNNGFADGMVQTHANYLCGTGPSLQMQTRNPEFNQIVERSWHRWCKAIQLRRKLWCMGHAKVQDGEAFAVIRNNPRLNHAVDLDLVLFETERCQTPMLPYASVGYIDGIRFDEFGNPIYYDVLPFHPGGAWSVYAQQPEQIPAKYVLHWFMLRRPEQHRGIPEFRSTLNTGAGSRRWREATLAAAETAADIALLLETELVPETGPDLATPGSTSQLRKRTMVAAPAGYKGRQITAEHPNATYEAFQRGQLSEQSRPKNMPYNVAACDSSSYNYASGRLDHQTYYGTLDIEREDANDLVLDPLFSLWWERAVLAYGWNTNERDVPDHVWDWPKHPVADVETEANANDKKLRNGSISPSEVASAEGEDFQDRIARLAKDYGVDEVEMRKVLMRTVFQNAFINEGAGANNGGSGDE